MKRLTAALAVLGFLFAPVSVFAATAWDGSESTDWSDVDNWDNGVPGTTSDVDIPSNTFGFGGNGRYPTSPDADTTIGSLSMNDGSVSAPVKITVPTDRTLTVTNALTVGHGAAEDTESYVEKPGAGTISAGSIVIQGGSTNQSTTLVVSAGSIVTT